MPSSESDAAAFFIAVEDVIAGALARELGLRDDGSQGLQAMVLAHLQTRRVLLVLDNFEHLAAGAAVVARWMAAGSFVQILATSRVPLQLAGEREFPVAPLALPARKPLPDVASLSQYAAVALFIERARAVKPEFEVDEANAPAIAEICTWLDGLPLAIELAAARVKLLPPATMMTRLGRSLSFLIGGPRDVAARQQTLRAAIAWSYDLLGDDQKRLFRRLGVFRGGFGFDSAEQVCAESPDAPKTSPRAAQTTLQTASGVFEGVASLLNQSLLVSRDAGDGEARFGLLETIREFALDQLDAAGEGARWRERHAAWCAASAQARDAEMRFDLRRALRRFEVEADNWRAAWAWSIGAQPEAALRMAAQAALLWNRIGGTSENYERLEASLLASPDGHAPSRCRALHFLVQAERNRAEWTRYEVRLRQLEALSQAAELPEFEAMALDQRMWDAVGAGNIEAALKHSFSIVALRQGCLARARNQALDRGEAGLYEVERCEIELHDAMILQVEILAKAGRLEAAWALMDGTLALKRASRDEGGLTFGLYKYAQLLAFSGRWAQARAVAEEVVARSEESGDRSLQLAWYRHCAAYMGLQDGDLARGEDLARARYAVFEENRARQGYLPTLHLLIWLRGLERDWPLVARLLGTAAAARNAPYPPDWRTILSAQESAARAALGEREFELQRQTGAQVELQAALEAAFSSQLAAPKPAA